ncbi:unnamed protein product [Wuchereria bancrofti]|uniref:GH18 domain-containing protein n=1 Tax=Wuchereria bancrofti TaxID=6293 RepID=A0A3P7EA86_WUCBA|nr:unnamed protein product [Wuchereria bancrofti]
MDYVQIMNYDFHMYSKLQPCTGFNAPLFSKQYEFGILSKMNSKSSFEVCNLTKTKNYKYVFDEKTRSAYMHGGDRQWLGLENSITMFSKASYIKTYNLAGIMIYDLASDDYKETSGDDLQSGPSSKEAEVRPTRV